MVARLMQLGREEPGWDGMGWGKGEGKGMGWEGGGGGGRAGWDGVGWSPTNLRHHSWRTRPRYMFGSVQRLIIPQPMDPQPSH